MVIYSTKISVKKELTREKFADMVVLWNQGTYSDKFDLSNVSDYTDLSLNQNGKTLVINELSEQSTIQARFQKEEEGVVWTTYFILNYVEHKLAVYLSRETTDELESFTPTFHPPKFIKMIINEGLASDDIFSVNGQPQMMKLHDIDLVRDLYSGKLHTNLPVVYVTKNWEEKYPLKTQILANELSGVAHVLIECDPRIGARLSREGVKTVKRGQIGIFYPSAGFGCKVFSLKERETAADLQAKVLGNAYRYSIQRHKGYMYTWEGVQNERLKLRNKAALEERYKYETERSDLYNIFDEQLKHNEAEIETLNKKVMALEAENNGLRSKLMSINQSVPLLTYGLEDDLYNNEIKEIIVSSLKETLKTLPAKARRRDVIEDIIECNETNKVSEQKADEIKRILKGYTKMDNSLMKELEDFGFRVEVDSRHYKLTYFGDSRYTATLSKTSSDGRSGNNLASIIKETML